MRDISSRKDKKPKFQNKNYDAAESSRSSDCDSSSSSSESNRWCSTDSYELFQKRKDKLGKNKRKHSSGEKNSKDIYKIMKEDKDRKRKNKMEKRKDSLSSYINQKTEKQKKI